MYDAQCNGPIGFDKAAGGEGRGKNDSKLHSTDLKRVKNERVYFIAHPKTMLLCIVL